jgi:multiple sugar transport system substrate-binding protein
VRSRGLASLTLLLLGCIGITACTPSPPEQSQLPAGNSAIASDKLRIWWAQGHYTQEDDAIRAVVKAWDDQNPDIEVELTMLSEDDITQQTELINQEGEGAPDVLFDNRADTARTPRWAWDGTLLDVSQIMAKAKDDYLPSAVASVQLYNNVEKKTSAYAIPTKQASVNIHYWTDLLAEAGFTAADIPQDWDAFWDFWKTAQDNLRKKGNKDIYGLGLTMSTEGVNDTYLEFEQMLAMYDVEIVSPEGKLLATDPLVKQKLAKVLDWYTQFYKQGYVPPDAVDWVGADNNNNFLNRRLLMTLNISLSIPGAVRENVDTYRKIATINFPNKPNGEPATYVTAIKQAVIFKNTPHQQAAESFVSYLIQPENMQKNLEASLGRWIPVMPAILKSPYFQNPDDPHISTAVKQFTDYESRPLAQVRNPAYVAVQADGIWGQAMEAILVEGKSPQVAADEAVAALQKAFDEWQ